MERRPRAPVLRWMARRATGGGLAQEHRIALVAQIAETLGEHVFDFFLRNKRQEWDDYRREITPFERRRYLPLL